MPGDFVAFCLDNIHIIIGFIIAAFCVTLLQGTKQSTIKGKEQAYVVLITGCDSGFGLMASLQFAKAGFLVVSTCMTVEGMDALKGKVEQAIICDVTKDADVDDVIKHCQRICESRKAKLWAVVANAGVAVAGAMDWMESEALHKVMEVNYFGVVRTIQKALPLLKTSPQSRIILISSMAGLGGFPLMGAYCASKFAVQGMAQCLLCELRLWNIFVCTINPGFTRLKATFMKLATYLLFRIADFIGHL